MNRSISWISVCLLAWSSMAYAAGLERLKYNHPGLVVDLGVGLWCWPLPMDYDGDGDHDLVVVCPDKPYNGTYFFENASGPVKLPVFKPAVRISKGLQNVQVSYVEGRPRVLSPGQEHTEFFTRGLDVARKLGVLSDIGHKGKIRANQWKYVDFDADGKLDLIVGIDDWADYGWDDAFNERGEWTNGPLHGYVYLLRNTGTTEQPAYADPVKLLADGRPVDGFGWPSPNLADFDGDGDLDLLCGEFLDKFTYYENRGARAAPDFARGQKLTHQGQPIAMDLQMIVPVAFDWDSDGDFDLIVGDEDGRVALIEHTGKLADGVPQFLPPVYFQQVADEVKYGALSTPCGCDWDGDGDEDIIAGNTAGYIGFIENLGGQPLRWAAPRHLEADGQVIRIQAGPNGSIQGPCEAKWGYTSPYVADWDQDGLLDILANTIWGRVLWFRNVGSRTAPALAAAQPIDVQWPATPPKPAWNWWNPEGQELVTQWRTTPLVVDWNHDGLNDLVMLDHEGYLAWFERRVSDAEPTAKDRDVDMPRAPRRTLLPGQRIFLNGEGQPLQLNPDRAGKSGRRKLAIVDWDQDGKLDVLVNSINANWLRQDASRAAGVILRDMGPLDARDISGHTSSPSVVDWNGNGIPELLIGAENGYFYHAAR